jgi:amino acid adenylation domain-containing protein/thioester reductase-like protein
MEFTSFPLTQSQQRRFETSEKIGNHCLVYKLTGPIEQNFSQNLHESVLWLEKNCEVLSFRVLKFQQSHQILKAPPAPQGLRILEAKEEESATFNIIENLCHFQFRMDTGLPYVFALVQGPSAHYFVFACHPVLMDRFSLKPLMETLSRTYKNLSGDNRSFENKQIGSEFSLSSQQAQLINAESNFINSEKYQESLNFWLKLVKDSSFEWQPGRDENALDEFYFTHSTTQELTENLKKKAKDLGISVYQLSLLCFHILLSRFTNSESILTSFYHRIDTDKSSRILFNENKLALRSQIDPASSAQDFLQKASDLWSLMQYHAGIPARSLASELLRIDPEFKRVTNVLFTEDCLPYHELNVSGLASQLLPVFTYRLEEEDIAVHVDNRNELTFHVISRSPQGLSALKTTFEHFDNLLEAICEDSKTPLQKLRIYNVDLLKRFESHSRGGDLVGPSRDIISLLQESVRDNPDKLALRYADKSLSFKEFQISISKIASLLPTVTESQQRLGIFLNRSLLYVETMFATLWRGECYIPLDVSMPHDRLRHLVEDGDLSGILVDSTSLPIFEQFLESFPQFRRIPLIDLSQTLWAEEAPPKVCPGSDLAYMIYTSGTTGKPKGVPITRDNLAHLLNSMDQIWPHDGSEVYSEFASFTFDATILGLFHPVVDGQSVILVPTELRTDPEGLFQLFIENNVTHAEMPPAMLALLPRKNCPSLRRIICGGEAIDEDAVRFWSKAVELANCYGPTEGTVMCTMTYLSGFKTSHDLGRPIPGYKTYLFNEVDEPTPLGGVGEICVAGLGVCPGYFRRPDLNQQKFISNSYDSRIYRTGDLGRFLPNGELEFLGRADFQVKIRGFRIELGDIESAISSQAEVLQSYVTVFDRQGEKTLAAWFVAQNLTSLELKKRLEEKLPHYMVPAFLTPTDQFPLTLNGKIDRALLLKNLNSASEEPSNPTSGWSSQSIEGKLLKVWSEVLKISENQLTPQSHFFHAGGHSLSATLVASRVSSLLGIGLKPKHIFAAPVFQDFVQLVRVLKPEAKREGLRKTLLSKVKVNNRMVSLMYSRALLNPNDNTYNIVTSVRFSEGLDSERLRQALQGLLKENPIFSCAFHEEGQDLLIESDSIQIEIDCKKLAPSAFETAIQEFTESSRALTFNVQKAPLWRAQIVESSTTPSQCVLLFTIHHSLFDGWSLNLFLEELAQRYEARSFERKRFSYLDYCAEITSSEDEEADRKYWQNKLSGAGIAEAKVDLPWTQPQTKPNSNRFLDFKIDKKMTTELKRQAQSLEVTLPPLLFTLFNVWIWRLSNQLDLIIGYPSAGRDQAGTEDIFGAFVKIAFLRCQIQPRQDIKDLVKSVHEQMIQDKEHLTLAPYDAEIPGMDSLNVIFSLQSGIGLSGSFGQARFYAEEQASLTAKADITGIFYERENEGTLEGRIEYDGAKFETQLIEGFLKVFQNILESFTQNPKARVNELNYLSVNERKVLLKNADGGSLVTKSSTIFAAFQTTAMEVPDKTALIFKDKIWRYRELMEAVLELSIKLENIVQPRQRVGLCVGKSDSSILAILALLRMGASYVPMDSNYPIDRLKHFVKNTNCTLILFDSEATKVVENLEAPRKINLAELIEQAKPILEPKRTLVDEHWEAYVIHTSGSTGLPKGVMIRQEAVVRMIEGARTQMKYPKEAISPLYGSLSFDTSVLEIFLPLLTGATLYIVPEEIRKNPELVFDELVKQKVSHAVLAPALVQSLPQKDWPSLKVLGFGGDSIDEATAAFWSQKATLLSCYGPTETTVQSSAGVIAPHTSPRNIGSPQPGYKMYLLNRSRELVPPMCWGEIYIGGEQTAIGYIGQEELTRERFVWDPFSESPYARMYKTGDLGRATPEGQIEFMGRLDHQVKIRGFRIEFGEIEDQMHLFPGIRHAACAVFGKAQNKYIAGFYVRNADESTATDDEFEKKLRQHLAHFLPEYMVPSFLVRKETLPISINGKVDRKSLQEPTHVKVSHPPLPGLETEIASIWAQILGHRAIPRDQSFFYIGGNSLLAVRLQKELHQKLGSQISISDIYLRPTIEQMALYFQRTSTLTSPSFNMLKEDLDKPWPTAFQNIKKTKSSSGLTHVLLTGASGFLGIFILQECVQRGLRVTALVRCQDESQGLKILQTQAERASLEVDWWKVQVVPGDLALPSLGLSENKFLGLGQEIQGILHCGAYVHHLHSYATLRDANVNSTRELLKLALMGATQRFAFVSTAGVGPAAFSSTEVHGKIPEAWSLVTPSFENGYILSKFAGEKLTQAADEKFGLSTVILRAGNITGSSVNGYSQAEKNHFWLYALGCLQMGRYPRIEKPVEMTPVDIVAKSMVEIFLNGPSSLKLAHILNPNWISQSQFFAWITESLKIPRLQSESNLEWQSRLTDLPETNGLYALKEIYASSLGPDFMDAENAPVENIFSQEKTLQVLREKNVSLEIDYEKLIGKYLPVIKKTLMS